MVFTSSAGKGCPSTGLAAAPQVGFHPEGEVARLEVYLRVGHHQEASFSFGLQGDRPEACHLDCHPEGESGLVHAKINNQ